MESSPVEISSGEKLSGNIFDSFDKFRKFLRQGIISENYGKIIYEQYSPQYL